MAAAGRPEVGAWLRRALRQGVQGKAPTPVPFAYLSLPLPLSLPLSLPLPLPLSLFLALFHIPDA